MADAVASDARVVLTRDRQLLKRNAIRYGYWIRNTDPRAQFTELVQQFDLACRAKPFTRCLCCNGLLQSVSKAAIAAGLPPRTRDVFDEFHRCCGCYRIYWRGSHYQRLSRLLPRLLAAYATLAGADAPPSKKGRLLKRSVIGLSVIGLLGWVWKRSRKGAEADATSSPPTTRTERRPDSG